MPYVDIGNTNSKKKTITYYWGFSFSDSPPHEWVFGTSLMKDYILQLISVQWLEAEKGKYEL